MLAHNQVGLPARFRIDGVEHRAIGERLVRRALGDVKPGGSQPLHEVRQLSGRWVDHGVHVHRGLCGSMIRRRNGAGGQRDELQRGALRESRSQRREADRAHGFAERDRRVHALRRRLPPECASYECGRFGRGVVRAAKSTVNALATSTRDHRRDHAMDSIRQQRKIRLREIVAFAQHRQAHRLRDPVAHAIA